MCYLRYKKGRRERVKMSGHGHWTVAHEFLGHNLHFNMDTILTMWFTMAILLVLALLTTRKLSIFPSKIQLLWESFIGYFADMTQQSMGMEEAKKHNPLILTLFFFILTANLVGQLPWVIFKLEHGEFASPNNDINMTAAMAIVVSIYYIYYGVKKRGLKFFFPGWDMNGIIMTIIDGMELVIRPFSLALRLFANILAGEILIVTLLSLCWVIFPIPLVMKFFELFVALIQAMVFALLATTYITMSVSEEH